MDAVDGVRRDSFNPRVWNVDRGHILRADPVSTNVFGTDWSFKKTVRCNAFI